MKEKIEKTLIELTIDNQQALFIILGQDGTLNRKGNGNLQNISHDMYMGKMKDTFLFENLKTKMNSDFLNYIGKVFDIPDQKGNKCSLKILFQGKEINTGLEFHYGELSQGPPQVIINYVMMAINITDFWIEENVKTK
tara:strand:+ start:154 stop:567 length:414 start_codon:yes stop_codon:yes gene_type:complete